MGKPAPQRYELQASPRPRTTPAPPLPLVPPPLVPLPLVPPPLVPPLAPRLRSRCDNLPRRCFHPLPSTTASIQRTRPVELTRSQLAVRLFSLTACWMRHSAGSTPSAVQILSMCTSRPK